MSLKKRSGQRSLCCGLVAGLVVLVSGSPIAADVLVLRDGTRVETQGSWEVKGRQIQFRDAKGVLSALRASEVDLAASEAATKAQSEPALPEVLAVPAKPQPVLVLTDKDIAPASVEQQLQETATLTAAALKVVSSEYRNTSGDPLYEISGRVENSGGTAVEGVRIVATVTGKIDSNSRRLFCDVTLPGQLGPGLSSDFRCGLARREVLATGIPQAFENPEISFAVTFKDGPKTPLSAVEPAPAAPKPAADQGGQDGSG
jgi:hypothetical protein